MRISGRRFVALLARASKDIKMCGRFGIGGCGVCVGVGGVFVGVSTLDCCVLQVASRWAGIKMGLCAGCLGALPLLVLRQGGGGGGGAGCQAWAGGITKVATQKYD